LYQINKSKKSIAQTYFFPIFVVLNFLIFMWNWQTARVTQIVQEASETRRFFLRVENTEHFAFRAGQFITLDLPVSAKRLQRWRSYSIASVPEGGNVIELCIVRLDGGLGTAYLFDTLKIGDTLTFKGADGTFVLPENPPKKMVMIATGTGIAPFRSMIGVLSQNDTQNEKTQVHLIFGTRTADGILYKKEWQNLQTENPNFQFSVALSREDAPNTVRGYVHQIYTKTFDPEAHYYLCGWKNMIDEAVENLKKLGLKETQLHYELYG
jgi:ferredoxin-NADP reductase